MSKKQADPSSAFGYESLLLIPIGTFGLEWLFPAAGLLPGFLIGVAATGLNAWSIHTRYHWVSGMLGGFVFFTMGAFLAKWAMNYTLWPTIGCGGAAFLLRLLIHRHIRREVTGEEQTARPSGTSPPEPPPVFEALTPRQRLARALAVTSTGLSAGLGLTLLEVNGWIAFAAGAVLSLACVELFSWTRLRPAGVVVAACCVAGYGFLAGTALSSSILVGAAAAAAVIAAAGRLRATLEATPAGRQGARPTG